jgi:hypothetical protein
VAVDLGFGQATRQALDGLATELGDTIVSVDRHWATGSRGATNPGRKGFDASMHDGGAVRNPPYDQRSVTLCTLCRRNLLAGERFRYWRNARERDASRVVCHLCEPSAARGGWQRLEREHQRENAVGLRGTVRLVA